MSRFRLYPKPAQEAVMFGHCAQARHAWNLARAVNATYRKGGARQTRPVRWAGMCAMLTEVRRTPVGDLSPDEADYFAWVASGNADVQQQALKDFDQALSNFLGGTHGYPQRRKKHRHESFRAIGNRRVPVFDEQGEPALNAKGKQVHARQVSVHKLNRKWTQVKVPGCGWVKFRNTRPGLPDAKSFRVTYRAGQWHISFATMPDPIEGPKDGTVVGVDRGVAVTAALSDGRKLHCPGLTHKEQARLRKHQRRAARAPKGSHLRSVENEQVARIKRKEANRRKDWCERTSTMLARTFDLVRFEDPRIKNMVRSAKGTVEEPGRNVRATSGLNRAILAQGWGLLRQRTGHKAPGRVEDIPPQYTSWRCNACGHVDRNSRESQALFRCTGCGFTCNADTNASGNVAAGQGVGPGPLGGRAGGTTRHTSASVREPQRSDSP
ncbi:transposase [Nocardiopsis sp. EMB25]|uniref:RNA-guided endonuclease InsQ/TnpB family protein n=1 Tax=Nocardiopsis sp. EMB25 TaxID=2835867 RepID=UPI0022843EF3|nr:transposase [Nocardiopsis sp. EMB25]MCY9783653.1 transposase [Nocardiopsis sp. EMB25]